MSFFANNDMLTLRRGDETLFTQFGIEDATGIFLNHDETIFEVVSGPCHLYMIIENLRPDRLSGDRMIILLNQALVYYCQDLCKYNNGFGLEISSWATYTKKEHDDDDDDEQNDNYQLKLENLSMNNDNNCKSTIPHDCPCFYRIVAQSLEYCFSSPIHVGLFVKSFHLWLQSSQRHEQSLGNCFQNPKLYDENGILMIRITMDCYDQVPFEIKCITKNDIDDDNGLYHYSSFIITDTKDQTTTINNPIKNTTKLDWQDYAPFFITYLKLFKDQPKPALFPHHHLLQSQEQMYDVEAYMDCGKIEIVRAIKYLNRLISMGNGLQTRLLSRLGELMKSEYEEEEENGGRLLYDSSSSLSSTTDSSEIY